MLPSGYPLGPYSTATWQDTIATIAPYSAALIKEDQARYALHVLKERLMEHDEKGASDWITEVCADMVGVALACTWIPSPHYEPAGAARPPRTPATRFWQTLVAEYGLQGRGTPENLLQGARVLLPRLVGGVALAPQEGLGDYAEDAGGDPRP